VDKALNIAKYFLSLQNPETGDTISNMKLQKLLYYAQGYYLALNNSPLFDEEVTKWQHGPVVIPVYEEFKEHQSSSIPAAVDFDSNCINSETKSFLDQIYTLFGQYSAWKLSDMTHNEDPWKSVTFGKEIKKESMQEFYKNYINN